MSNLVMAIVVCGGLFALTPSAHAARAHPTDPVASPRIVYPYVDGGRPDATTITFNHVPHPVLSVYDLSDQLVFRGSIRGDADWNPRVDGDVLGADLTDDAGRIFRVCVDRRGKETIGNRYCTKVRVVHVQVDSQVSRKRLGRVFYSKTVDRGCAVRRQDLTVVIDCDAGATAVLRYDMDRPSLTSEQSFLGPATFAWKGRYYHWGDGISLERTVRGADVTASGGFSGKLSWVKKIWSVRTEY
jgi:hypothetical protein